MVSAVSSTLDGRLAGTDLKAKGPARRLRAATLCPATVPTQFAVDDMARMSRRWWGRLLPAMTRMRAAQRTDVRLLTRGANRDPVEDDHKGS